MSEVSPQRLECRVPTAVVAPGFVGEAAEIVGVGGGYCAGDGGMHLALLSMKFTY
jgi:hypothetical protein